MIRMLSEICYAMRVDSSNRGREFDGSPLRIAPYTEYCRSLVLKLPTWGENCTYRPCQFTTNGWYERGLLSMCVGVKIQDHKLLHSDVLLAFPRGLKLVYCWMHHTGDPATQLNSGRTAVIDDQYAHIVVLKIISYLKITGDQTQATTAWIMTTLDLLVDVLAVRSL